MVDSKHGGVGESIAQYLAVIMLYIILLVFSFFPPIISRGIVSPKLETVEIQTVVGGVSQYGIYASVLCRFHPNHVASCLGCKHCGAAEGDWRGILGIIADNEELAMGHVV